MQCVHDAHIVERADYGFNRALWRRRQLPQHDRTTGPRADWSRSQPVELIDRYGGRALPHSSAGDPCSDAAPIRPLPK